MQWSLKLFKDFWAFPFAGLVGGNPPGHARGHRTGFGQWDESRSDALLVCEKIKGEWANGQVFLLRDLIIMGGDRSQNLPRPTRVSMGGFQKCHNPRTLGKSTE